MAIVSLPLLPLSVLVVGTFNLLCCLCLDPRSNPAPIPSPAAPVTAPDGFPAAVRGAISRQRRRARFPLRRREVGRARALGCPVCCCAAANGVSAYLQSSGWKWALEGTEGGREGPTATSP